jgi:hypothetical protein
MNCHEGAGLVDHVSARWFALASWVTRTASRRYLRCAQDGNPMGQALVAAKPLGSFPPPLSSFLVSLS